jgi:hypothetical protein
MKPFGTTKKFIQKARIIHGHRYIYKKVKYVRNNQKVHIVCRIHGDFHQTPNSHLHGSGCPSCAYENRRKSVKKYYISARKSREVEREVNEIIAEWLKK